MPKRSKTRFTSPASAADLIQTILAKTDAECALDFHLPRVFASLEEWRESVKDGTEGLYWLRWSKRRHTDSVTNSKRYFMLADGGGGKSTELRYQAIQYAKHLSAGTTEHTHAARPVPIFLSLRDYTQKNFATFLRSRLGKKLAPLLSANELGETSVRRVFLLDGLDEIPAAGFSRKLETLIDFLSAKPFCDDSVVISSRLGFYEYHEIALKESGFQAFVLLGLVTDDIRAYCDFRDCNPQALLTAANGLDLEELLYNPFHLQQTVELFKAKAALPPTRSGMLRELVNLKIDKRPIRKRAHQLRSLKAVGLAMELFSRNFITDEELGEILHRFVGVPTSDVDDVIESLTRTFLLRSGERYFFESRVFGEYFAADELRGAELRRIQGLVFVPGTRKINPSWSNAVALLIEMHDELRQYAASEFPALCVGSSASAFSEGEKKLVFESFRQRFDQPPALLSFGADIRASHLARFIPKTSADDLRSDLTASSPYRRGNAALLLGFVGHTSDVPVLKSIAFNKAEDRLVREGASFAVSELGTEQDIPDFWEKLEDAGDLKQAYIRAVAQLSGPATVDKLLACTLQSRETVWQVRLRIEELKDEADVVSTLQFLARNAGHLRDIHFESYFEDFWPNLALCWSDSVASAVAEFVWQLERSGVYYRELSEREKLTHVVRSADSTGQVAWLFLQKGLIRGIRFVWMLELVAELMTEHTARSLVHAFKGEDARRLFVWLANLRRDLREIFRPYTDGTLEVQEASAQQYRREQEAARIQREEKRSALARSILEAAHPNETLKALNELPQAEWPTLTAAQKDRLRTVVEAGLAESSPERHAKWINENQLVFPYYGLAELCLRLVSHYRLRLRKEDLLVACLLYTHRTDVMEYFKSHVPSSRARAKLVELFAKGVSGGALHSFLHFIEKIASVHPDRQLAAVSAAIATNGAIEPYKRSTAVRILSKYYSPEYDSVLRDLAQHDPADDVVDAAHRELCRLQDVETVHRLVNGILQGNQDLPTTNDLILGKRSSGPLGWLGAITGRQFLGILRKLLAYSLKVEHSELCGTALKLIGQIDRRTAIDYLDELRPKWPTQFEVWLKGQRRELDQAFLIEQGRAKDIRDVEVRLQGISSINRAILYCEGSNDIGFFEEMLVKMADTGQIPSGVNVKVKDLGGWGRVKAASFSVETLLDECRDCTAILDGDERDRLTGELTPDGTRVVKRFSDAGLDLTVLRCPLENYFTTHALETTYGIKLASGFNVARDATLSDQLVAAGFKNGHDKKRNRDVARHMSLSDIRGTDLGTALERFAKMTRSLVKDSGRAPQVF